MTKEELNNELSCCNPIITTSPILSNECMEFVRVDLLKRLSESDIFWICESLRLKEIRFSENEVYRKQLYRAREIIVKKIYLEV